MFGHKLRVANVMLSSSDKAFGTEMAAYHCTNMLLQHGHPTLFVHRHDYDLPHVDTAHANLRLLRLPSRAWGHVLRGRRALRRFAPDVIIVHNHFSRMLALGWGIAPMIGVAHLDKFSALRRYDGAVALRPDTGEVAKNMGLKNVDVIGNASRLERSAGSAPPPPAKYFCGQTAGYRRHRILFAE